MKRSRLPANYVMRYFWVFLAIFMGSVLVAAAAGKSIENYVMDLAGMRNREGINASVLRRITFLICLRCFAAMIFICLRINAASSFRIITEIFEDFRNRCGSGCAGGTAFLPVRALCGA